MSAAIQLVNQPLVNTDTLVERPFNNVSRFESAPEQRLRRALEQINELQAEVRTLRDELARTERISANYELLLRNAVIREQELRAQLAQEYL
jgi:vacuolar-type H+-ATPase subunit I/STV1